jgi:DNA-binding LacI/PurR family transcriptional regulator
MALKSRFSRPRSITIKDAAQTTGVSYSTVSLNNNHHVRADKRLRLLEAASRQQARSLADGRSQVIGLLVSDVGYTGQVIAGIDQAVAGAGCSHISLIADPDHPVERVVLDTHLIICESCGPSRVP